MLKNKFMRKIIALVLVLLLTATNFIFVASEALALYEEGMYIAETKTEKAKEDKAEEKEDNTVKSRIDLQSNKNTLFAAYGINDVTLTITLLTDDSTRDILYKNPKFTIQMPEHVTIAKVEKCIKASITADEKLGIKITDHNDKQVTIQITGEQTEFNTESESSGAFNAQITVDMKLSIDKTVSNTASHFLVTYENENDVDEENAIISRQEQYPINIDTGFGIVTNLSAQNYDGKNGVVEAGTISGGITEAQINMNEESKMVNLFGSIANNSSEAIELKSILVNVKLNNYNGHETVLKTYEVPITETEIKSENDFRFEDIGFNIPENLYYNEKINISYVATYMYKNEEYQIETAINLKTEKKDIVGDVFISNDRTARIEIAKVLGDGSLVANDTKVKEGATVKYLLTITNLTSNPMKNISVNMTRENNNSKFYDYKQYGETGSGIQGETLYTKQELEDLYKTLTIEKIDSKQNGTVKYELVVANNSESKELVNKLEILVNGTNLQFGEQESIRTSAIAIEDANLKVNLQYSVPQTEAQLVNEIPEIQSGQSKVPVLLALTNLSNEDLTNVDVELNLSKYNFISNIYLDGEYEIDYKTNYNKDTGIFKFTIPKLAAGRGFIENIYIDFYKIKTPMQDINFSIGVTANEKRYISNQLDLRIIDLSINVETTVESSVENGATVKNGSDIEYTITIKNVGNNSAYVTVYNGIPSAFTLKDFSIDGESRLDDLEEDKINYNIVIEPEKTVTAKIILTVNADILDINNQIVVSILGQSDNTFEYNYKVAEPEQKLDEDPMEPPGEIDEKVPGEEIIDTPKDPDAPGEENNPKDPDENTKEYTISGKVWLDSNRNGAFDSGEQLLSNIKVMLIDSNSNNAYVKDKNGNNLEYTTGSNGEFKFLNLPEGKYYVVFDYDSKTYELTAYKNTNIDETINSDVKNYTKPDGTLCGITDSIELKSNVANVNMGLVVLPKFDLKVENSITKVIVQNTAGTTTTEFNNSKLAKIEIPRKVVSGSTVLVEYTIKITNTGDLEGNVQEIVNYLPDNIKFNSELNKDWYIGTDGNIYNNSLANTSIAAGETKTLTLILTKNMTTNNVGTTKNTVEITKYANNREFADINISDNKDYSEILITISTGDVVMYITLAILSVIIIAGGVYFIKKKIL